MTLNNKDSGVEWLGEMLEQGSETANIFQTGLTGSTGCVLLFNPVHPVILSRINKPQMNADERRLIVPVHREKRKAQQHKTFSIDKIIRPGTRMTQIGRISTDNEIRVYPRHPRNPRSIVYNAGQEIRYNWHFSSIKEQEAAQ